jgi:hypothetical protein
LHEPEVRTGQSKENGMTANASYQPATTQPAPNHPEAHTVRAPACTPAERITRSLLGYGVIAGPIYVVVSLAQAVLREGFDLSRHEWSLLANGPWGWIQIANLVLTGLMVVAAAVGYRRRLTDGIGRSWAPRLLAVYGISIVAAGIFTADPMSGFPLGTPEGPPASPTVHGLLHLAAGSVGFLAVIATTFILARRFRSEGRPVRAVFSALTGIVFLAGFAAIASGSGTPVVNLTFTAAVVLMWAWITSTSASLYRHSS